MKIRHLLLNVACIAVVAAAASAPAASSAAATPIKNIVLVHGAWADGSGWEKVIPILLAKGYHVVAVQNPLTSLTDDVVFAKRIIDGQDGPVLLVGHSYGGVVITQAGDDPKVVGLVYVAAFAPDVGEGVGSLAKLYPPSPAFGEIKPTPDGYLLLTPKGMSEDFAQDLTPAEKNILWATQGATNGAILGTNVTVASWHDKPSWFVVASNDRTIPPELEKFEAQRMKAKVLTVGTSHVAMLAAPDKVADFIAQAAESGGAK